MPRESHELEASFHSVKPAVNETGTACPASQRHRPARDKFLSHPASPISQSDTPHETCALAIARRERATARGIVPRGLIKPISKPRAPSGRAGRRRQHEEPQERAGRTGAGPDVRREGGAWLGLDAGTLGPQMWSNGLVTWLERTRLGTLGLDGH